MKNTFLPRITNWALVLATLTALAQFAACDVKGQNNGEWQFDLRTILPPPEAIPREAARAVETRRQYPPGGTCDLAEVYGINKDRDYTLRQLGYTELSARDSFPTFAAFWDAKTWPMADMLDLYEYECAWNDWVWHTDTYLAIGPYIRANFVTQSRGMILSPDGWYRLAFGCQTGIGRYIGKHAQVYSDRTGQNPGCTPGTALEIDHGRWSKHAPDRVCLNSTAWGKDYGVIGGMAYTEGVVIENFRVVGNKTQVGSFTGLCTGITLNEPGENSRLVGCMAESFPGSGYSIFNGTPFDMTDCSAFNNRDAGADFLGSNGLCNVRVETLSGDNNEKGLARIRPKDAQSVGGGTFVFTSTKSEARNIMQRPFTIEGPMGDLNLVIDGVTANFEGVTCDYLIGGNWTGNQFEVSARGVDLRSNTQALFYHAGKGWLLTGGRPFSGNSFTINDEGLKFQSRSNMTLSTNTPPVYTGTWTAGTWSTCTNGTQTRTVTCSNNNCDPATRPADNQTCGTTPPPTGTMTAKASHTGTENQVLREAKYMVDADPRTFWISGQGMTVGSMNPNGTVTTGTQWVEVDYGAAAVRSSVSFDIAISYTNSFPRTFDVWVSANGTSWTAVKTSQAGAYPTCTANFTGTSFRYARAVCKTANSNWWAIATWR